MAKYICTVCGYIYDGTDGAREDLPEDFPIAHAVAGDAGQACTCN